MEEQNLFSQQEEKKEGDLISGKVAAQSSSPADDKRVKENMRMFLLGLVGLVGVALALSVVVGIYRVYAKASTDTFTSTVAKVLRLPAMKVNGQRVLYSDYVEYLAAVKKSVSLDASSGQAASLTSDQVTDRVLWWLADRQIVSDAGRSFGISVEDKDLESVREQALQSFKTITAADQELEKRYGWTFDQYLEKIMRTMVLQQKLGDKISLDQKAREEVRNQAQKVLDQIKAGASFEDMAKQYGQDGTAANGGSLGWFGKGDMVPQFETAVFALKKGELDPNLVETQFGYHIIKVNDFRTEKVKDSKGKMVNQQQVNASHILFGYPSIDQYLNDAAKKAVIQLYINVHNPFSAQGAAPGTK